MSDRPCTCHPLDNPPSPCPQKFAFVACRIAALARELNQAQAELSTLRAECERLRDGTARPVHIVFDGPPSHESGRFIEVEDSDGVSINAGRWEQRGDFWHLIIDFDTISNAIYAAGKAQP